MLFGLCFFFYADFPAGNKVVPAYLCTGEVLGANLKRGARPSLIGASRTGAVGPCDPSRRGRAIATPNTTGALIGVINGTINGAIVGAINGAWLGQTGLDE